jgi:hypothetical protein
MSRGFVCSLFGIGMTVFSWYGPWEWPAWPAFAVLHAVFGSGTSWQELPYAARGAVLIVLIIVNSGFWGGLAALMWHLAKRVSSRAKERRCAPLMR